MNHRRRNGFTLVELLFAAAIITLILAGIHQTMLFSRMNADKGTLQTECTAKGCLALEHITRIIRCSERILYPRPGGEANYLVLQDSLGTRRTIYVTPDGERLCVKVVGTGEPKVIAGLQSSSVLFSNVRFRNVANQEIFMIIAFMTRDGKDIQQFTQVFTSFKPRNHH